VAVLAFYALKIFGDVLGVLVLCMKVLAVGGGAWFVIAAVRLVGDLVVQAGDVVSTSVVRQLIKVLCTLLAIFAAITAGFLIANLFGVPVEPILAGLGIGGLAIALAIRPTLENVIGGLTLFADRPIRVGEFGRFGNESGTVEEIGLRTTKVRRLDDTLATIPNSELAQIRIENVTRRRKFLFNPTLGLRYETTAAQLKQVEAGVLAVLAEHPKVLDDGSRIRFTSFGDYALNLDVFAYVDVTKMPDFLVAQEEINLRIMDVVTRAGTGFAFPSQTNYIAKDTVPGINDSGTNE
jgi:MscS family membrane protein